MPRRALKNVSVKSPEFLRRLDAWDRRRDPSKEYTYREIASELGVSFQTVFCLEQAALKKVFFFAQVLEAELEARRG
jgi:hypothetical protein